MHARIASAQRADHHCKAGSNRSYPRPAGSTIKTARLATARRLLAMPQSNPRAVEDAQATTNARRPERTALWQRTSTLPRGLECEFAVRAAQLAPCLAYTRHAQPLPERSAETYTAHATANPAVQSNTVYPTPCTVCAFDPLGLGVG
jgi:hypothetical protein